MNPSYITPVEKEIYYIDVITRGINTNTGVNGQLNNFTVRVNQPLSLNKRYWIEIIYFSYKNITSPIGIKPLVLTDVSDLIKDNGQWISLLYKSNVYTGNSDMVETDVTNNINFKRRLSSNLNSLETINIQIQRSDNGNPFPFDDNDPDQIINIVFKIKSE